jgi:predicted O-methyltransferase YrrM
MGPVAFRAFNLDPTERFCLGGLAQIKKPKTIFEIGTYDGTATLILARAAPDAKIYTLDLPKDLVELAIWDSERRLPLANGPGEVFRGTPESERITQLEGNSLEFDFEPFKGAIDLALVDGNHQLEFVVSDSASALKMLAPGGMIIWDDYGPEHPGVVRAVDDFARHHQLPVTHLVPTELVVYDSPR